MFLLEWFPRRWPGAGPACGIQASEAAVGALKRAATLRRGLMFAERLLRAAGRGAASQVGAAWAPSLGS